MPESLGCAALAAIDHLLEDRPDKAGHDFSTTLRCLAAWRDALAQRWRRSAAQADYRALARVNAGLSVILGGQFPLEKLPWDAIERVQEDLAELLNDARR